MGETTALRLADEITQAILQGEYPAGTRLDETSLAQRFNLSRTPIREALAEVCSRGLAERKPYRGVEVIAPDPSVLLNRFEALAELEALCAELAAHRGRIEDVLALESLVSQMAGALPEAYQQLNFQLHARIGAMSGNPELVALAEGLRLQLQVMRQAQLSRVERREHSQREHRALVEAIANRDASGARHAMRHHFRAAAAEALALLSAKP